MGEGDEKKVTASPSKRRIPIIVVPGIAGSRLSDPGNGKLVWNPLGGPLGHSPATMAADKARLMNVGAALVPDETHGFSETFNGAKKKKAESIPHFYNVITDYYGDLAIAMHDELPAKLASKGATSDVFVCGYDWRQDNAASAARLASVVAEAQKNNPNEKVIILAHSMGGLVSRYFSAQLGGKDKIRALFLLASPSFGAPQAYGYLRRGLDFTDPIRRVLNIDRDQSISFMRHMASVHQLLPTDIYNRLLDTSWVKFDKAQTGYSTVAPPNQIKPMMFSDLANVALLYLDPYVGLQDDPATRTLAQGMVASAIDFHFKLTVPGNLNAVALPDLTYAVYSTDVDTLGKYKVNYEGVFVMGSDTVVQSKAEEDGKVKGDKTVPQTSGATAQGIPAPKSKTMSSGIEHTGFAGDRKVIDFLLDEIPKII